MAVDILLSTYNGEKYLPELLASLENQSFQNFRILIRDDGSSDKTWDILKHYSKKRQPKVHLCGDRNNLGVIKSFNKLLQLSSADYIMFCDQDDVWYPWKIERTLQSAIEFEQIHGKNIPLLVHSDLEVVDESLGLISTSMWEYQKLGGKYRTSLKQLVVQNCITGCAMLINRSLAKLVEKLPDGIIMHDWYLGFVAASFGKIIPISEPLVKYRQHSNNVFGSKGYGLKNAVNKGFIQAKKNIVDTYIQARIFKQQFNDKLGVMEHQIIKEYLSIPGKNFFQRRWVLIHNGFWKSGFIRNIGVLILV